METINTPHPVLSIPDEHELALAAELSRLRIDHDARVLPAPRRAMKLLRSAFAGSRRTRSHVTVVPTAAAPQPSTVMDR